MNKIICICEKNLLIKIRLVYNSLFLIITPVTYNMDAYFFKHIKFIYKYWYGTYNFYWLRMVWRGKAYRVRFKKKKRKLLFNLGHSHWTRIMYKKIEYNTIKIKRRVYMFYFKHKYSIDEVCNTFVKLKKFNQYTLRGARIVQRPLKKRYGGKVGFNKLHDY